MSLHSIIGIPTELILCAMRRQPPYEALVKANTLAATAYDIVIGGLKIIKLKLPMEGTLTQFNSSPLPNTGFHKTVLFVPCFSAY